MSRAVENTATGLTLAGAGAMGLFILGVWFGLDPHAILRTFAWIIGGTIALALAIVAVTFVAMTASEVSRRRRG